mgnify:CR=1 FL=1
MLATERRSKRVAETEEREREREQMTEGRNERRRTDRGSMKRWK